MKVDIILAHALSMAAICSSMLRLGDGPHADNAVYRGLSGARSHRKRAIEHV